MRHFSSSTPLLTAAFLSFCSCGPMRSESTPQLYSLDGVKLIAESITSVEDPSTYQRMTYSLNPTRRLMLRFEGLAKKLDLVDLSEGQAVTVEITVPTPEQFAGAKQALSLCPLTRNWMMLSSWLYAEPFGESGRWQQAGGDFDSGSCLAGEDKAALATRSEEKKVEEKADGPKQQSQQGKQKPKAPTPVETQSAPSASRTLVFNVTQWFIDYPRGRGKHFNFGLILIASAETSVVGDASGSYSPRILFKKFAESSATTEWTVRR